MKASKGVQKVILFLVFFSLIISCIAISTTAANAGKLGDINSDGSIDSIDVSLLKRHKTYLQERHTPMLIPTETGK